MVTTLPLEAGGVLGLAGLLAPEPHPHIASESRLAVANPPIKRIVISFSSTRRPAPATRPTVPRMKNGAAGTMAGRRCATLFVLLQWLGHGVAAPQ